MPTYLIEREFPGAQDLTAEELRDISRTSNATVDTLGVPYTWHQSFAAGDKIYCLHEAESPEVIVEHARRAGFPVNLVSEVANTFGPQTADA